MSKPKENQRDVITPENIKKLRDELGMDTEEFAKFLNVSPTTVERWEQSKKGVSLSGATANVLASLIASEVLHLGRGTALLSAVMGAFPLGTSLAATGGIVGGYQIYRALKTVFEPEDEEGTEETKKQKKG